MFPSERDQAFARLRTRLPPTVVAPVMPGLQSTGIDALDAIVGGGFVPGSIVTIEGEPSSGSSGLVSRLLAAATRNGIAALIEQPASEQGRLDPSALAEAGVDLDRLFIVDTAQTPETARACDQLIRAGLFAVVVLPMLEMKTQVWTRLARLAHRHACMLLVVGRKASSELRFCATMSLRCELAEVRWGGMPGIYSCLQGAEIDIHVIKNKAASPDGCLRLSYDHARPTLTPRKRNTQFAAAGLPLQRKRHA